MLAILGCLLLLCACSGVLQRSTPPESILSLGDSAEELDVPVMPGRTITYGLQVLQNLSDSPVTLHSARLTGPATTEPVKVGIPRIVGPERRLGAVAAAGTFPPKSLRGVKLHPLEGASVEPKAMVGPEGYELLFPVTPAARGRFTFDAIEITFEHEGQIYTLRHEDILTLCVSNDPNATCRPRP